jgi:hypothetical protein
VPGPTAATIAVNTPMEVSRVGVLGFYQRPLSGSDSLKQAPCREPRSLSHFQQSATSVRGVEFDGVGFEYRRARANITSVGSASSS